MNAPFPAARNAVTHSIYKSILKPLFFRHDPEAVHDRMTQFGALLGATAAGRGLTSAFLGYQDPILEQSILGIGFRNPIGLSAGFDKNAELTQIIPSVGFGFMEIGSVTGEACPGNPKPRLWRLPKSESLSVWYGLKNDGCEEIASRLSRLQHAIPVGANVAMTNCTANLDIESGIRDFAKAFRTMEPVAAYLTVNISCPNAQGGQPFMRPEYLERLLTEIDAIPTAKPVFVKLSPDLSPDGLDGTLDVLARHRVHGVICSNLTKDRMRPAISSGDTVPALGGFSGKAVRSAADGLLARVYERAGDRFVLVGSGGVFTAEDAYRKIRLGASLVQLVTGMIFEGPQVISDINIGLVRLLRRDGFRNVSEAVGIDNI